MNENSEIRERAIPGTHAFAVRICEKHLSPGKNIKVLDIGAGQGALTKRLLDAGYDVEACELFTEQFKVAEVPCHEVDLNKPWPFPDHYADGIVAVELVEHIEDHLTMFSEASRVLKPGGKFLFSTPNILSLKSRLSFLFTGYFYSFGPLSQHRFSDGRPHVSPFTIDRYRYLMGGLGLELIDLETDKLQNSSKVWAGLIPLIRLYTLSKWGGREDVKLQNSTTALLGRKLVAVFEKQLDDTTEELRKEIAN